MLTDSHTHLNVEAFQDDQEEVIQRALEQGVTRMVNVGFNRETIPSSIELAEMYDFIYSTVGWHPVDAIDMKDGDLEWIEQLCKHEKVVAIGEIGLDYHWDTSPKEVQKRIFRDQIRLARKLQMPILHIPQLVAMALGVSKDALRLQTHIVRPTGMLASC